MSSACVSHAGREELDSLPAADSVVDALGRSEYRIGPSDLLTVTVFQVDDLNREVRVNNAGLISLPLVGAVDVAGRTVGEIEELLAERYSERYLRTPQVSVFVKEFSSQRVTVSGAVKKPGIYPMASRLTLVQSISLAEGLSEIGSERNVLVFRTVGGERKYARFDVKAINRGEQPDPEIYGDDVIVVDTSAGRLTLKTLVQLAPFVAVWRAYQ
nr:polysaccharide biosynthesis/export family protein [Lysobacter sp. MMG2]